MIAIDEWRGGDTEVVRRLFRAYAASLPFSLEFQGFAEELAGLPAPYIGPNGCLLLAMAQEAAVGVAVLKPLGGDIAEIKRLYVEPAVRGRGVGRALVERILAAAQERGHRRVRLDTHRPSMAVAMALYRRLGFVEIPPYGPNPDNQFAFFEKAL